MKKTILFIFPILLSLVGCTINIHVPQKDTVSTPPANHEDQGKDPIDNHEINLRGYFPQTFPTHKAFQGIGNEFAQYTETFYENDGPYFPAIYDNGGNRFLRIYKVTKEEISLVYEQPDFYSDELPVPSTIVEHFYTKPILKLPLQTGTKVGEWIVVKTEEMITVPFGKFSNVIVIEQHHEDGSSSRQYWVKKYGKIKDEFIIKDQNGEIVIISSELDKLN